MAPWTLARLERAVESFSAQLQCAICLCAYEKPVSLPCNHCFCEECIHRALELKPLCPICKAPAKKRRLRYDSTVQELLRATEMLCAAPTASGPVAAPPAAQEAPVAVKAVKAADEKQVKAEVTQVNATAQAARPKAVATPERRSSPRRRASHSSQKSPSTPTLMDVWMSAGNTQLLHIKTEKAEIPDFKPRRRSSPRRALTRELNSQATASPMSPALFEITAPKARKTRAAAVVAGSSSRGISVDSGEATAEGDNVGKQTLSPWRRRTSPDTRAMNTDTAADETQLDAAEPKQQTLYPRRVRSSSDADEVDVVVAETQPEALEDEIVSPPRRSIAHPASVDEISGKTQIEEAESKQQTPTLRDRRRSAADTLAGPATLKLVQQQTRRRRSTTDSVQEKTQVKTVQTQEKQTPALPSRLRSASNPVALDTTTDETELDSVEPTHQTPPPRKRRRSSTNGVTGAHNVQNVPVEPRQKSIVNGKTASANGSTQTSSLAVASQTQLPLDVEVFQVGDLVDVVERQWPGINKRGGTARITKVHGDGFYAVKFLIVGGSDHRVPGTFIRRPAEELVSDSTPSHSIRKRQRRRLSDSMVSPDLLAVKTRSSPHSAENGRVKTITKSKTTRKFSGMVFLCSGFKEDRMQQIDEWADLLGAEVVQHWTNHVSHLIVKCVSEYEAEENDLSLEDSDSASSPQGHTAGKRKLFGSHKPGRWVKIRSLKYLKALVGGRWIVSDEWLQACSDQGGHVSEVNYEADGHWKGRRIHEAVKRSRQTREKLLRLSSPDVDSSDVGTMLFADFCFHVIGEFLPPMPPITELTTLICMGGGKLIPFMDDIPDEMHKTENHERKLIIVSDKINPIALRQQTKQLTSQPQVKAVSPAIIVNYLWVINSISEAKLRELP